MDTLKQSKILGDLLFKTYEESEEQGVGDLVMEWANDHFYGKRMEQRIADFNELWDKLNDNGFTSRENSISYGDADQYVWAEQLDDNTKLIINHDVVTCADDNTTIYKMLSHNFNDQPRGEEIARLLFEFHIFTAFEQEKKRGDTWGDRRDYDRVSLQTYRDKGFDFGYGDGRDNTHVGKMKYDHEDNPRVENSTWTEGRLKRELRELHRLNDMFDEEMV